MTKRFVIFFLFSTIAFISASAIYLKFGKIVISTKNHKKAIIISKRCIGSTVELFSNDNGTTFEWQKNDIIINGATKNSYKPTAAGKYKLIVDGVASNEIELNFANPTVSFTHNSTGNACGTETVKFTNTSTNGETYEWDFGDGQTSTEKEPTHEFKATPGGGTQSFNVKLTVTSAECKSVISSEQTISVKQTPDANLGGTGSYTYENKPYFKACSNNASTFNFTNQSTTTGINISYKIDWGDGSTVFESNTFTATSHSYSKGIHTLTYTVTGSNGCVSTIIYTVFVGGNPAVGLGNPGNTSICTGQTLEFPVTLTENNPMGTTYTIKFNDGSPEIVLPHPLPPDYKIVHTFTKSSCDNISYNGTTAYRNAFALSIEAYNPCGKSGASVVPIYVSDKPKASFTIDKGKTVCENTSLKFTSTSKGNTASSSGCQIGKLIWVVEPIGGSPMSGYSTSSKLGNDFGLTADPSSWDGGATSINILFKTAGKYRVSLKVAADAGTGNCGPDLYSEEICVNPKPTATFTLPTTTSCAPFTLKATNTSSAPNCGTNTYQWTVTSSSTDCDVAAALPTYINGTNATSANPEFKFDKPGKYRITLTTTSGDASCSTTSTPQEIIVKAPPTAVINLNPTSICEGASISPTATVKNCYAADAATYLWEATNANITNASSATPTITFTQKGSQTIKLTVTNSCGTNTYTKQLTVTEVPVLNSIIDKTFCNGEAVQAINFGINGFGSATYTWTNSNSAIGLAASGTGNLPSFTAKNTGTVPITATITVTPKSGNCTGLPKTFTITVNPGAQAANAGVAQNLCNVTSTVLDGSEAKLGGEWSVVSGTGISFTDKNDPKTQVSGLQPGVTYTFKWTVNGYAPCSSSSATVTITVAPTTVGGTTSGATKYCGTSTIGTVTLTGHTGKVVRWEKSTNGTNWTDVTPNNTSTTLTYNNLSTTTYYRAIVKSGFCNEEKSTETKIEIAAKPNVPTATQNYTYCLGETASQLTATGTDLKWY